MSKSLLQSVELCDHTIISSNGYYVCTKCGSCISNERIIDPFPQYFRDEKNQTFFACEISHLTQLGTQKESSETNFKRLHLLNFLSCNNISELKCMMRFKALCHKYEVRLNAVHFSKTFHQIYPKLRKGTKGRNINNLTIVLFILSCKMISKEIDYKTVIKEENLATQDYFIILKRIYKIKPKWLKFNYQNYLDQEITKDLSRIKDQFNVNFKTYLTAKKIIGKYRIHLGLKSKIISSSAIVLADRILNEESKLSIPEISRALNISSSTVYAHVNTLFKKYKRRTKIETKSTK